MYNPVSTISALKMAQYCTKENYHTYCTILRQTVLHYRPTTLYKHSQLCTIQQGGCTLIACLYKYPTMVVSKLHNAVQCNLGLLVTAGLSKSHFHGLYHLSVILFERLSLCRKEVSQTKTIKQFFRYSYVLCPMHLIIYLYIM